MNWSEIPKQTLLKENGEYPQSERPPALRQESPLYMVRAFNSDIRGFRHPPLIWDDKPDIDPELFQKVVNGFTSKGKAMNDTIRQHVLKYNIASGHGESEEDIIDTILEGDFVWRGKENRRRWWSEWFTVVKVDGMLIGFEGALTSGDDSPQDKGWEFDPSSICEVTAKVVTTNVYEAKP